METLAAPAPAPEPAPALIIYLFCDESLEELRTIQRNKPRGYISFSIKEVILDKKIKALRTKGDDYNKDLTADKFAALTEKMDEISLQIKELKKWGL